MGQKLLEQQLPEEEVAQLIQMYQNNISLREIERQTGHNRLAVAKMLERLGIKTITGNHYRKYFFDFNFFETIDNELKAYWLGFFYADGSISNKNDRYGEQEFKLALAESDIEILEKYKEDLNSTYPIRFDKSKQQNNPNHQIQAICCYRSQKTVDDLKKLGCVENKSLILKFPTEEQVPSQFIYHFIRGYFDGDGSISNYNEKYQISFVGTKDFIMKLSQYFNGGSILQDTRKENSWYFNLGGNLQVIEAYHKMYDGANRYMKRKFNKFQDLLNKYGENQGIKV